MALLFAVIAGTIAFKLLPKLLPELSRGEFLAEVRGGHVQKVVIEDLEVITGVSSTRGVFRTAYRKEEDSGLAAELRAMGVEAVFMRSSLGLI